MRIVVKGADFSAVSIGKVIEDLSFTFQGTDFLNYDQTSGTGFSSATYYIGSSSSEAFGTSTNANRGISDYIKVIPGMTITFGNTWSNTATVPTLVPFNANKEILSPAKGYWTGGATSFVIPDGVYYIKLQSSNVGGANATGVMPV